MAQAQAMAGGQLAPLGQQPAPGRAVPQPAGGQFHGQRRHVPGGVVLRFAQPLPQAPGQHQVAQAQPRGHGLGQPGEVDHLVRGQTGQRRRPRLRQQAVHVLLHQEHVPAPGQFQHPPPPLQPHGGGGGVVQGGGQHRQTHAAPAGGLERLGQDPLPVHGHRVQATPPMPGRRLEPRVDQRLAGHLPGFRPQAQGRVHGVLGARADLDGVRVGLHPAPAQPVGDRLPVPPQILRSRVVQEPGRVPGARRPPGQIRVLGQAGRPVGGQVDEAPRRALADGEDGRLRVHPQHVGAAPHLAAHQPAPRRLLVGPGHGAQVHPQQIRQQPVGGQPLPRAQAAGADVFGDGVGHGQVHRRVGVGQIGDPGHATSID